MIRSLKLPTYQRMRFDSNYQNSDQRIVALQLVLIDQYLRANLFYLEMEDDKTRLTN